MLTFQDKKTQKQQNEINNALAAEYKTANEWRRHEILTEYYKANEAFVKVWKRWDHEHWADLTQNFVTHWHRAFSEYTPLSADSNFNLYMHRKFKSWASEDHSDYLAKASRWCQLGYIHDGEDSKRTRKELFVHPTSDTDRRLLRQKLSRNLDEKEQIILDHHFFDGEDKAEVAMTYFKPGGKKGPAKPTKKGFINQNQCYDFCASMKSLMLKLHGFKREDFR